MITRLAIVLLLLCSCKLASQSARTKAGDGLPDGAIVLTPGTPQSPNPAQCKSTISKATASESPQSSTKGRSLQVDLAWQFSDVKEQLYGDCYVYGGLGSIEAYLNRQYKNKPQISLSEPYAVISTFVSPEGFEYLKNRWIEPIATASQNLTSDVVSGGGGYEIAYIARQYPETVVLNDEFSYSDLERVTTLIRSELIAKRTSQGLVGMNYKELDGVLASVETHLKVDGTAPQPTWLADYTKSIRSYYLKRSVNDPSSRAVMQGILNSYLQKNPRSPRVTAAIASLGGASLTSLFSEWKDNERTAMETAGNALEAVYKKIAKDAIDKRQARWTPLPWDLFNPTPVPSSNQISTPDPATIVKPDELPLAIKACHTASAKMRESIIKSLCDGVPVSVGGAILGMLTEEEDNRFSDAIGKVTAELRDWQEYLKYLANRPQNIPPSLGLAAATPVKTDPMGYKEFKALTDKLSSPSRGNTTNDPNLGTYLNPLFQPAEHMRHAMIIDGFEVINGVSFWRLRNSWGGTGSAYIQVAETCRFTSAFTVTKNL